MNKNKKSVLLLSGIFGVGLVSSSLVSANTEAKSSGKNSLVRKFENLENTEEVDYEDIQNIEENSTYKEAGGIIEKVKSFFSNTVLGKVASATAVTAATGGLSYYVLNTIDKKAKKNDLLYKIKGYSTMINDIGNLSKIFKDEPACVTIEDKPTVVVGDLHFNKDATSFINSYFGEKKGDLKTKVEQGYNLVFLGDIIDRGFQAKNGGDYNETDPEMKKSNAKWRLKTLEIIMDLKNKYPDKVTILSGNHENGGCGRSNFKEELKTVYGEKEGEEIFKAANDMFQNLPKCAVLKQKDTNGKNINTFLVHGSVPKTRGVDNIVEDMSKLNNKEKYSLKGFDPNYYFNFIRKDKIPKCDAYTMLWNDYVGEEETKYNTARTGGYEDDLYLTIGKKDLEKFKTANDIQRVISAHDHSIGGYKDVNGDGTYIKVVSTPWHAKDINYPGYILDIGKHGNINRVEVEESS